MEYVPFGATEFKVSRVIYADWPKRGRESFPRQITASLARRD
jgi:hypothetical protein